MQCTNAAVTQPAGLTYLTLCTAANYHSHTVFFATGLVSDPYSSCGPQPLYVPDPRGRKCTV